eukprot:10785398-Lingulodinium_polyedra.AAC.1
MGPRSCGICGRGQMIRALAPLRSRSTWCRQACREPPTTGSCCTLCGQVAGSSGWCRPAGLQLLPVLASWPLGPHATASRGSPWPLR